MLRAEETSRLESLKWPATDPLEAAIDLVFGGLVTPLAYPTANASCLSVLRVEFVVDFPIPGRGPLLRRFLRCAAQVAFDLADTLSDFDVCQKVSLEFGRQGGS
jgi:hypothetical protein